MKLRSIALLSPLLAAAPIGCGGGDTAVLELEVSAETGHLPARTLTFVIEKVTRRYDGTFPAADGRALRIGLANLPGSLAGTRTLAVTAMDADQCVVGEAQTRVMLKAGARTSAAITVMKVWPRRCDGGVRPPPTGGDGGAGRAEAGAAGDGGLAIDGRIIGEGGPVPPADGPSSDRTPTDAPMAPTDMRVMPTDGPAPARDAPTPPPDGPRSKPTGEACASAVDCTSGFCADGVCCNAACTGQCQACNGAGTTGMCVAVAGDPRGGRPACAGAGTPCAGACNGTSGSACTYPGASRQCGDPSCTNGMAQPAATCDGRGGCSTPAPISCAPYPCGATACAGGCSDNSGCSGTTYCEAGRCVAKLQNGASCRDGGQCTSGICADGVCCNGACTGDCEACNLSGKAGTCSFQQGTVCRDSRGDCDPAEICSGSSGSCPADALHGGSIVCRPAQDVCDAAEVCPGNAPTCPGNQLKPAGSVCRASAGTCDVAETCSGSSAACPSNAYAAAGTVCQAAQCTGGTATSAAVCSGGVCGITSNSSCSPYACDGTACATTCKVSNQCQSPYVCKGEYNATCVSKVAGTWRTEPANHNGRTSFDNSDPPTGACSTGQAFHRMVWNAPNGTQYLRHHAPELDYTCTGGKWFYTRYRAATATEPAKIGAVRPCNEPIKEVPSAGGGFCLTPAGDSIWHDGTTTGASGSCNASETYVVETYYCD